MGTGRLFVPLRRGVVCAELFESAELAPYAGGNPVGRYLARPVRIIRGYPAVPMRDHTSMSDAEIREHLTFGPRWFALRIMDEEILALTVTNFRASDDDCDEHWRYGAFMYFISQHPSLTPDQCEGLFELGAEDPDWTMGQSIMLRVLERPECPASLRQRAATHPKTLKYYGDSAGGVTRRCTGPGRRV